MSLVHGGINSRLKQWNPSIPNQTITDTYGMTMSRTVVLRESFHPQEGLSRLPPDVDPGRAPWEKQ